MTVSICSYGTCAGVGLFRSADGGVYCGVHAPCCQTGCHERAVERFEVSAELGAALGWRAGQQGVVCDRHAVLLRLVAERVAAPLVLSRLYAVPLCARCGAVPLAGVDGELWCAGCCRAVPRRE